MTPIIRRSPSERTDADEGACRFPGGSDQDKERPDSEVVVLWPQYKGDTDMAGWYELSKTEAGKFRFVLKAGNAQTILTSELYESKSGAENGIAAVQTNSPLNERYEEKTSASNQPYFTLKAGNHQVIGTSQMYSSVEACKAGIESVKTNGPSTTIKDNS